MQYAFVGGWGVYVCARASVYAPLILPYHKQNFCFLHTYNMCMPVPISMCRPSLLDELEQSFCDELNTTIEADAEAKKDQMRDQVW